MLLAIDIGNTNIVVGAFKGESLVYDFRLKTDTARSADEYAALMFAIAREKSSATFTRAIVSSVVPPLTPLFIGVIEKYLKLKPIVVGPGIKTTLPIKISEPASLGADRVVNALAVKELFGTPALAVDFGTATSLDYVSAQGNYEGGVIVPGVVTALDALVRSTAKLPRIELAWPKSVVGKGTVHAMQSGAVIGYMCMVDGLIDAITNEVGDIPHIIATGGLGDLFTKHSKRIKTYDPHLTLKGMRLISDMND